MKRAERKYWAEKIVENLIKLTPNRKIFICAAGITPSGIVHIGNFRDVITSDVVRKVLKNKRKKAKFIFFWDDYDRLRKIPQGMPSSFSKYIGMSISEIPDPYSCHKSYAEHFEREFEEVMPSLGIEIKFVGQEKEYKRNKYYKEIKTAMQKRKEIAKILSEFKTQEIGKEDIENFYPFQVYCEKCKKDTTSILDYDEEDIIEYSCKCGFRNRVDISKKNVGKLKWKIDWAARWKHYNICFEPGGQDHATPGGSYDVSSAIAKKIYGINPPLFQGYAFVGVKGVAKMSSSTGTGIAPKELLKIYEPELLRWLFTRTNPEAKITFCFDSELIRQYDEFDREIELYKKGKLAIEKKRSLEFALAGMRKFGKNRVSFRQVATFGQVAQGNFKELKKMFKKIKQKFDEKNLKVRLEKSENWIKVYSKELEIKVGDIPNSAYFKKLKEEEQGEIKELLEKMGSNWNLEKLTWLVYEIPKKPGMNEEEKKKNQRRFFKNVYQMLIDSDTGPRLPTFLLALGKEKVKNLLKI